ncbi:sulfatase [Bacteroidales bacterium OttesenSCG-928-A17]|nr:sulfatase [Bacteroidales bacterium OttesenSCG-928-A17]
MKNTGIIIGSLLLSGTNILAKDYPNIVLINMDDAGLGDFSYKGAIDYETPNIDQLAANGRQFTHFLCAQPVSGASRAGLLTGCYPNRIGFAGAPMPNSGFGIHEDEMTLAELVKQKGYSTAIFGKWHLGDSKKFLPLQHGFDEYYGLPHSNDMWMYHPQQGLYFNFKETDLPTIDGNEVIGYNTDQTQLTTDYTNRAVRFIEKNKGKPFFLYVAHSMPHVPLAVSDKFKGKSKQGLYGDVMMELDWSVGEILKTLQKYDLEENTLVILTSDNGPWINYGNHAGSAAGLREGKGTTFEGGNRVPCIMYWKGTVRAGSICNELTSQIDLFPSIAELIGAELPQHTIDGTSILPLITGNATETPRKNFVYYYRKNDLEAITDGTYKLIFPHKHRTYGDYLPGNDGQPGKVNEGKVLAEMELFDLRRDPGERYNVIEQYPEVVNKLVEVADYYREELGDNLTNSKGKNVREAGKK